MEVSHYAEDFSHVVLGGEAPEAFGITDDASFFTILSDTLYTDKKRACVREVICNAWDAHIAAGKTHLPIIVDITETSFAVRDQGFGIAHVNIGPIYCVYGKSTKAKDDNQTGGFGLGCKAPFAIASNFTVESFHKGNRSVYAISRGSEETMGKPDYRRIAVSSTDETGIKVTVPIEADMREEMVAIARSIAMNGGIPIVLNSQIVTPHDWAAAEKQGFALVERTGSAVAYVRYGTVLYPIATTDTEVLRALSQIGYLWSLDLAVALTAAPGTIAIAPSREAVSMTDRTKATILQLLRRAIHGLHTAKRATAKKRLDKEAESLVESGDIFAFQENGPGIYPNGDKRFVVDPLQIGLRLLPAKISDAYPARWKMALLARASRAPEARRVLRRLAGANAGKVSFMPRAAEREATRYNLRLHRRLVTAANLLNQSFVITIGHFGYNPEFTRLAKARMPSPMSPSIFVGFSQREINEEIAACVKEDSSWKKNSYLAITLKPHQQHLIAKIKESAERYGFHVRAVERTKPEKVVREKRVKSYASFAACGQVYDFSDHAELESPKSYLITSYHRDGCAIILGEHVSVRDAILRQFSDVALVHTERDENLLIKSGVAPLEKLVFDRIDRIKHRKSFVFAYRMASVSAASPVSSNSTARMLIQAATNFPEAAVALAGGGIRVTQELREAFDLARIFCAFHATLKWSASGFNRIHALDKELRLAPFDLIDGTALEARFGGKAPDFFSAYHTFTDKADVEDLLTLLPTLERRAKALARSNTEKDAA